MRLRLILINELIVLAACAVVAAAVLYPISGLPVTAYPVATVIVYLVTNVLYLSISLIGALFTHFWKR